MKPLFVTRDRAQGQPAYNNCHPFLKDKGKRIKDKPVFVLVLVIRDGPQPKP